MPDTLEQLMIEHGALEAKRIEELRTKLGEITDAISKAKDLKEIMKLRAMKDDINDQLNRLRYEV